MTDSDVLIEATIKASYNLGISKSTLNHIVGYDLNTKDKNFEVLSTFGKKSLSLIRIYKCLYAMYDGNFQHMRLWINGFNSGTNGIPLEQIQTDPGLIDVLEYLEAMHYGKL